MAGAAPTSLVRRFRRTLPGALIGRALAFAPRFKGRGRRSELALTVVASLAASILLGGVVAALARTPLALVDLLGLCVLTGLPILAAMIRRLHDTNRHGWAIFVALFPYVGWVFLFVYLIRNGSEGDNAFGPNPRA